MALLAACRAARETAPLAVWREPVTGMVFRYVPPGRFPMGGLAGVIGRQPDEVQHEVVITRGYYLGTYEVTQGESKEMTGENPSQFPGCGSRCPVET